MSQRYFIQHYSEVGPAWRRCEQDLAAAGVPMPLPQRSAWAEAFGTQLFAAFDAGRCRAAIAVEERRTRALPGHCILRADRVGAGEPDAVAALLAHLTDEARSSSRVLRVEVVVFARDAALRDRLGQELAALGFAPPAEPQCYRETSCVDLDGGDEQILARFSSTARRNIRLLAKHPIELRPILDAALAPAMQELVAETRARTHGRVPARSLASLIELSKRAPELANVIGLFDKKDDQLLAFATGLAHGEYVTYADAASTRKTSLKVPLGYAPVWELMRWGRRVGARWFDFGGITTGGRGDAGDPLGGISHFKRMFCGEIAPIADEWVMVPRPRRAAFVAAVSSAAERLRART